MTTARDLALVVLGLPPGHTVEQGDLSLALAGAEAVDLLAVGALTLDGDRLVPDGRAATGDRLLDHALASLARHEPHPVVRDWLWRHGSELADTYAEDLERAGLLVQPRRRGLRLRSVRTVPADSPERRRAQERLDSGDPVLTALTAVLGTGDGPSVPGGSPAGDDAVATVLAAVGDAVTELEAVRLRRGVEDAAFDNMWRG
ncbi:GOLPH3/VPS74 family protein [Streptomyces chromofuscus]|uniref:GPP34 family phosphoprotein n=1 Tax=Streptomyces chromofuscus TaxID=42881 RepID=A0A7M2T8L7_STRCW|nr:GPP34 family phosphoprotein [Streptomyces chromofuscus]QOV44255.1 GPP34 family phosphoprotein [Streptomyces chromofuscus]GGT31440.1 hypothetical protein GCM10010254_59910 [Streptomyces chromofuscus]